MDRIILHCDCNSFFASVETALNPEYKNVPMAVCGSEENRHGIVLAKNELAKKYGIQTAETVHSARKKCPNLVIASPHYEQYSLYSKRVNEIYREYTELVESFGIDESWLDVTASQRIFGSGEEIAESIRNRIKNEIGITVSIGVSFNKAFAKLGSDYKKPDAVTVISRENFTDIVYPLPVSDLLFVGKRTAKELSRIGVRTIGDLAMLDLDVLENKFGKQGCMLYEYSRGLDSSPVLPTGFKDGVKSISNGLTFKQDLVNNEQCRTGIVFLCCEIGFKLRSRGLKCNTVALTIKDVYLKSIQRQRRLKAPSDIEDEISEAAFGLLCDTWPDKKPIRMLTVSVTGLSDADCSSEQLDIFDNNSEERRKKSRNREEAVDKLRQKFGSSALVRASFIGEDIGISTDDN